MRARHPSRHRGVAARRRAYVAALLVLAGALLALSSGVHCGATPAGWLGCRRERVLIVGAGAAGLAAGVALANVADVILLEGQERLGGRVQTNRSLGATIELAAVWIHRAKGNVVSELARQHGCKTFVSENKRVWIYAEDGTQIDAATVSEEYSRLSRKIMPEFLRKRAELLPGRDTDMRSLMAGLPSLKAVGGIGRCVIDFLLFRDVVQDHTADLAQSSALLYDTDHYGGRGKDELMPGGYDCIVHGMAKGLPLRLGPAGHVTRLSYADGDGASGRRGGRLRGVVAHMADGSSVSADRAIVTVPLGVLKAGLSYRQTGIQPKGAIVFDPPLPTRTRVAIARLGFGNALKVGLRFKEAFWPSEAHFLGKVGGGCDGFGSSRHMEFLCVSRYSDGAPVLLMETESAWAATLSAMRDEELVRTVTAELQRMFPSADVTPINYAIARLGNASFLRGSFSYLPPGGTHELHTQLGEPIANGRLILAGEHTSALHAGTVHGSIVAGRQAAAYAKAAMRGAPDVLREGGRYSEVYARELLAYNYGDETAESGLRKDGLINFDQDAWDRRVNFEDDVWDRNP